MGEERFFGCGYVPLFRIGYSRYTNDRGVWSLLPRDQKGYLLGSADYPALIKEEH